MPISVGPVSCILPRANRSSHPALSTARASQHMAKLGDRWARQPQPGMAERIGDAVKPKGPLKPRVQDGIKRMQAQIKRLDAMISGLEERDARLFRRIVDATQKHDAQASKVLGNELAEVRKVKRVLGNARTALEKIEMRLTTCSDLGDTVVAIMPTVGLMKGLKSSLGKIMPGAEQEIGQMADMLGGFMNESFSGDAAFGLSEATTPESEKILQEASAVASSTAEQAFPSVPADTQDAGAPAAKFL